MKVIISGTQLRSSDYTINDEEIILKKAITKDTEVSIENDHYKRTVGLNRKQRRNIQFCRRELL